MAYVISDACNNCAACDSSCNFDAISEQDGKRKIDKEKCVDCGVCSEACAIQAITGE